MSQITADGGHAAGSHEPPYIAARARIPDEAVRPPMIRPLSLICSVVGVICIAILLVMMIGGNAQATAAYHAGVMYCVGISLGALGLIMILQQFNAGWSSVLRRQVEHLATLIPVAGILFLPMMVFAGQIFDWMSIPKDEDGLLDHKRAFLNVPFWLIKSFTYFVIWAAFAMKLYLLSREQDESGDPALTARARRISSYGLLVFALTAAFASFDWIMSLDHHWFSTMFGVYFFAGSMLSAIAVSILVFGGLKLAGKLDGIVTEEHFHDMGKLLLSFTVFWAYISFSQYFLIWYSNIPEETAFYSIRQEGGWKSVFVFLCLFHFLVPFVILLTRLVKRSVPVLMLMAVWLLFMHAVDLFFMIAPAVESKQKAGPSSGLIIDILGFVGPIALFAGMVMWRVASGPLIPLKDPRLHEGLDHKNYV